MWNTNDYEEKNYYEEKKEEKTKFSNGLLQEIAIEMVLNVYRNKKSGNNYIVSAVAYDATNERDGNIVVIYFLKGSLVNIRSVFVRDLEEFNEKFEKIGPVDIKIC